MTVKGRVKASGDEGFVLATVLVAAVILMILLGMASTKWSFIQQREREEELIFRGTQYAQAIGRYYRKFKTYPSKLKELVDEKCIRKLYRDPMTESGEWILVYEPKRKGAKQEPRRFVLSHLGRIMGVRSSSKKRAIRKFQDKRIYEEWVFMATVSAQGPGGGGQQPQQTKGKKPPFFRDPLRSRSSELGRKK